MAIVNDTVSFTIQKTMAQLSDVLDQLQVTWKGKVGKIKGKEDTVAPDEYKSSPSANKLAIGFYGTKSLPMGFKKNWFVHLYFIESGIECRVFLAALGNSKLDSFWHGKSQVIDLQYSIEVRDDIVDKFKKLK